MCLGILYMLVLAPLSAPDEVSHYISAYELSNRFLGLPGTDEDGYIYIRAEDDWIEDVNQEFRDWKEKSEQESLNGENGETEAGKPITARRCVPGSIPGGTTLKIRKTQ